MTKSELVRNLIAINPSLQSQAVDDGVKEILEKITQALEMGGRVEIRGFGSFSLHHREARVGRNPKTGESVNLDAKSVPHFKVGKELKERVDLI